ncbi:uncharacterized protein MONBRDRAFT_6212 [Monosiga brevicollis MX1]|uniref:HMG box domain-containing protein n=1 Tax=Monosiga brevicollis TaxID=81824 RepID=A9UT61_MONBE|nr:uncharacterized protein MONBRDRAFT_6212 [Monosiga brevicollis MX1]EDQ91436.1 predicted protein [Monosiga brevicollis MX1]|eukprot:XP_001743858.1 hypothetical protein [Monosiga brevicollis MX1]
MSGMMDAEADPGVYEPAAQPAHGHGAGALLNFGHPVPGSMAPPSSIPSSLPHSAAVPVPSHPSMLQPYPMPPHMMPMSIPASWGTSGPLAPPEPQLQAPQQPHRDRRKKRKNGTVLDTEAGPTWWSEQDKMIVAAVIAQEQRLPIQQRYEREPPYDWDAIAPEGMTTHQARVRYRQLSEDIPRRRTNLEIAHIAMKNYYHALIRGKVLTTDQFARISHMRRQPGKLKAKDLYPNIPKKPMSAFLLWAQDARETIAAQIDSRQAKHIQKALSDRWKELSAEEKQPYQSAATENMTKYYAEMAQFYESNPQAKRDRKLKGVPLKDSPMQEAAMPQAVPPPRSGIELYTEDLKRARQANNPHEPIDENMIHQQASQEWHSLVPEKQAEYHRRVEEMWKEYESQRLRREEPESQYLMHPPMQQQLHPQQLHPQQLQMQQGQPMQPFLHPQMLMEEQQRQLQQAPPKPPTKPTAYKIFVEEHRDSVAESLAPHEKKSVQAKLRELWKHMSNKDRKPYKKKARLADDEYIVEMAEYHRVYGPILAAQEQQVQAQAAQDGDPHALQQQHQLMDHQQAYHQQQIQLQTQQYHQQHLQMQQQLMMQQQQQQLEHQHLEHAQLAQHHLAQEQDDVDHVQHHQPAVVTVPAPDHPQAPQAPEIPAPAPAPADEHDHDEPPVA